MRNHRPSTNIGTINAEYCGFRVTAILASNVHLWKTCGYIGRENRVCIDTIVAYMSRTQREMHQKGILS